MKTPATLFVLLAFAAPTQAVEAPKTFARSAAVKLLGYDPERSIADECPARKSALGLVRVTLLKKQPVPDRARAYFTVAGMTGVARAICPAASAPEVLPPFAKAGETFSEGDCEAMATFMRGKMRQTLNEKSVDEHPDVTVGFVQGLIDALPPLVKACEPYKNSWAGLAAQVQILTREVQIRKDDRACALWRKAYYAELSMASDVAEKRGRAAGLAYLKGKPLIALAGSRSYCTDGLGRAFEASNYDTTRIIIEATPVK